MFLMPRLCLKPITWYIEMDHVMNFFASRHHRFTVLCVARFVERRYELCVKKGRILVPEHAIDANFQQLVIGHVTSNGGDIQDQ